MKSLKFNNQKIEITFTDKNKAEKLFRWIPICLLPDYATLNDATITYDISNHKNKFHPLKTLLRKIVYDSDDLNDELYSSAFPTDLYDYRLNVSVKNNKLFRITPVKSDGTLGTFDFGVHQYTEMFSLVKVNKNDEIYLLSSRGHYYDLIRNRLMLDDIAILIEIGEISF